MISLGKDARRGRCDKILMAYDVNVLEGRNLIDVFKPPVNDAYHHVFSPHADVVKPLPLEDGDLFGGLSVEVTADTVAFFKMLMILGLDGRRRNAVRRLPHPAA